MGLYGWAFVCMQIFRSDVHFFMFAFRSLIVKSPLMPNLGVCVYLAHFISHCNKIYLFIVLLLSLCCTHSNLLPINFLTRGVFHLRLQLIVLQRINQLGTKYTHLNLRTGQNLFMRCSERFFLGEYLNNLLIFGSRNETEEF